MSLAPVQPSGWPSAMAPPLTFSRSGFDGQLAKDREHLRGERLVQLDEVDLIEREPGLCEHLAHGRDRSDAEALGRDAGSGIRDEARQRRESALFRRAPLTSGRRPLHRRSSATNCRR